MIGKARRDDVSLFIEEWAPDLAELLHDAWPALRYVGPRIIDGRPGLLLTAPRNEHARFGVPLNAFLHLTPEGLRTFLRDDLMAYAFFNTNLSRLDRYCARYDIDLRGGSQAAPLTCFMNIDLMFTAHYARNDR